MSEMKKRNSITKPQRGPSSSSARRPIQTAEEAAHRPAATPVSPGPTQQEVEQAAEAFGERNREALTELAKW